MKKSLKSNKGFTLIELVIVIAILGVLAAISISMFPRIASSSREKADETRANQIKTAISTYITESGDYTIKNLGTGDVPTAEELFTSLQAGVKESTNGPIKYGPYLEDLKTTKGTSTYAEPYLPQNENKKGWTITVDPVTLTVSVKVADGETTIDNEATVTPTT